MNVQALIDELEKIEDKTRKVKIGHIKGKIGEIGAASHYATVNYVDGQSGTVTVYIDAVYE